MEWMILQVEAGLNKGCREAM